MEWQSSWTDPFQEYLKPFTSLIGDRRTWLVFLETVKGIIASGSVIGQRIATSSPELSRSKDGGQRVLRMAKGESTRALGDGCRASDGPIAAGGGGATAPERRGGSVADRRWFGSL